MNKRQLKKLNTLPVQIMKADTPRKGWMKAIALNNMQTRAMWDQKNWLRKPWHMSFWELKQIAKVHAIIRICINVIKKAVSQSKWQIKVKDRFNKDTNSTSQYQDEINECYELFENMNENDENMRMLLDRVIEDILIYDAGSIEIIRTNDKKRIIALNSVAGDTIRPIVNEYWNSVGNIAYKQYIDDIEVASFSRDDLVYIMANPENSIEWYGFWVSPIESIKLQVRASLDAEHYNMKTFSTNNVPSWLLDLWDMDDAAAENLMAGWNASTIWNTDAIKFIRWSWEKRQWTPFQKSNKDMQFSQYIEWQSRIILATYWLTAQDANIDVDLNRSTAEVHASMSNARWVRSMKRLIEEYFTRGIIRKMWDSEGFKRIEFSFIDVDTLADMELRAKTDTLNIASWVYSPKYVQERDWYPIEKIPTKLLQDSIISSLSSTPKKAPIPAKKTILNYDE